MTKHNAIWLLGIIILIGIFLRSYHLMARSIWFDEAFTWRLLQFPFSEMMVRTTADAHPPLYYVLSKIWSSVFSPSLLALRSFSVTLAVATIALAYFFTSSISSRPTGLLAAAFVAASAWQIPLAWEARMYTLGCALALLSSWLLFKNLWAYAAAATAFAYTHYFAFFTLISQALVTRMSRHVVASLLVLLCYLPWLPIAFQHLKTVQDNFWIAPVTFWSLPDTFLRFFTSPVTSHHTILPLVLALLGACLLLFKDRSRGAIFVVLAGFLPPILAVLISLSGRSLYLDRYFAFAQVFLLISLAMLIMCLSRPALRAACIVGVLGFFLWNFYAMHAQLDIPAKPGLRAAAEYITSHNYQESILATSPFIFFPLTYYSPDAKLLSESPDLVYFAGGAVLTSDDIASPDILNDPTLSSIWLVDTTGFGSQITTLPSPWNLIDRQSFPEVYPYQGDVIVSHYQVK